MPQTQRVGRWYRSSSLLLGSKLVGMLKAPKYGSDALLFDLEDAVATAEKPAARKAVATAIGELRTHRIGRFVRLNAWRTGCVIEDLNGVVVDGLDGVALAKTEEPEDIFAL